MRNDELKKLGPMSIDEKLKTYTNLWSGCAF
jgi:hypothetical protein